jgi:hypothetical protein
VSCIPDDNVIWKIDKGLVHIPVNPVSTPCQWTGAIQIFNKEDPLLSLEIKVLSVDEMVSSSPTYRQL